MKVLFKNIQGLIFLSIVVAFSVNANAQMYGNMWGTGFSPGMQGCMAETEAFDRYGDIDEVEEYNHLRAVLDQARDEKDKFNGATDDALEFLEDYEEPANENAAEKRFKKYLNFLKDRGSSLKYSFDPKVDDDGDIEVDLNYKAKAPECDSYVLSSQLRMVNEIIEMADTSKKLETITAIQQQPVFGLGAKFSVIANESDTAKLERFDNWAGQLRGLSEEYNQDDLAGLKKLCKDDDSSVLIDKDEFCRVKNSIVSGTNYDNCKDDVEEYFESVGKEESLENFIDVTKKRIDRAKKYAKRAIDDAEIEGDWCADCAYSGYRQKEDRDSLLTRSIIGAGAGLLGQYLGLRAYKSVQNNAIDMAARAGHTYTPIPNFNLYSGLGLSAIGTISGLVNGSYMCGGGAMGSMGGLTGMGGMGFGGVYGMNNPYAMQMAMMGQGGAFGYPFGQNMMSPMGGMYYGGMGPFGVQTPFHMMGQMGGAMGAAFGPYASMYGPYAQMSPMLGLGISGMAGMPGANLGLMGGMNPYGMYSPYAMMSPFGGLSAYAGMGSMAGNPWNMMTPGMFGSGNGIMSCIQAPCQGNLFNPYGMGGLGGLGGLGGIGGIGGNSQQLQLQMQMLQQQQQQQMAYYQQLQQQTQQRMQAAQQLTQLQTQMAQLNQQAAQLASQAGIGGGIGGGIGIGGGFGIPSIYGSGSLGIGLGLGGLGGSLYGGFSTGWPYTGYGIGQISPNVPSSIGYGGSR
ncbi:MAG: hypothetical protein CL674_16165 [Bdellovibrionaceae bacterium]|nr:hypothetical protein [Pseudobdellovibrionaceae bacterium]|tara:strand:+ start:184271 stop:186478 length:2208 start_codon:yes stop_codon:yes gene_type:complete